MGALVNSTDVNFGANVGTIGLTISGGTVRLDSGVQGQAATWTLGLTPNTSNHLWSLAQAAGEVTKSIKGQVNINLPVFFPTPDHPLDPTTPAIEYSVTDITNPAGTTTEILPNFSAASAASAF